ncbi:MAG: hypothetical protein KDA89_07100, partial [Planctomycetaceae bacterium]|nr:hypothetical protein [Planctomycetaceae bacterium]
SKSKGNFFTVRDVLEGRATGVKVHPAVLRLELIKSHYRANMNFTKKGLQDSAGMGKRLADFRRKLEAACGGKPAEVDLTHPILQQFAEALADDLNFSRALAVVAPWAAGDPENPAEALAVLNRINHVLAIAPLEGSEDFGSDDSSAGDIQELCRQLDQARASKDYAAADTIRKQIQEQGYDVKTTPQGTVAEKKLA